MIDRKRSRGRQREKTEGIAQWLHGANIIWQKCWAQQRKKKWEGTLSLFGFFLTSSSTTRLYRGRAPRQERLTILRAATHETELGDHDFCLSRSHYTDTDPTWRERAATAGIEPGTSSPGVARSTAELPRQNLPYTYGYFYTCLTLGHTNMFFH